MNTEVPHCHTKGPFTEISDSATKVAVRLTETTKKGGCSAKLPAGTLRNLLRSLILKNTPELAVGSETLDDAALWDLGDHRYLIQTVDFFTPIVDDPYDFGAIAATNAISDIYAMGGEPKTALTILAFPTQTLDLDLLLPLLKGAISKIEESGACLAGGHSIDDETLKLGFSVAGFVDKEKAWKNSGARPKDKLILTKALGTGVVASAIKAKKSEASWTQSAINSMTQLNAVPALIKDFTIHAATDITGFGLAAHALQMARASGASFSINANAIPALPGAIECLKQGITNRAHRTNGEYVNGSVTYDASITLEHKLLTVDAQTSGGLLLSVPAEQAIEIEFVLREKFPFTKIIGVVDGQSDNQTVAFQAF